LQRHNFLENSVSVQRRRLAIRVSSGKAGKPDFHGIEFERDVAMPERWEFLGWERGLETGA